MTQRACSAGVPLACDRGPLHGKETSISARPQRANAMIRDLFGKAAEVGTVAMISPPGSVNHGYTRSPAPTAFPRSTGS